MKKLLTFLILLTTLVFSSCVFPFTQQESSESASSSTETSSELLEESSEITESEIKESSLESSEEEIKEFTAVGGYVFESWVPRAPGEREEGKIFYGVGLYFDLPNNFRVKNRPDLIAGDSVHVTYKGKDSLTPDGYVYDVYFYPRENKYGTYTVVFKGLSFSEEEFSEIVLDWSISYANVIKMEYVAPTETESARFMKINSDGSKTEINVEMNFIRWHPPYKPFCLSNWTDSPLYGEVVFEEAWEDGMILYASYSETDYNAETDTYSIRGLYDKNPRP